MIQFQDRSEAGYCLAYHMRGMRLHEPLVVAVPRGGVEVGTTLAKCLEAELDIALVRCVRRPNRKLLTLAAITEDGRVHTPPGVAEHDPASSDWIVRALREQSERLRHWRTIYRAICAPAAISGRSVILADDGTYTGLSLLAASALILSQHPRELIIALPCGQRSAIEALRGACSQMICLTVFAGAGRIARCYRHFSQVPESRVIALLSDCARPRSE